MTSFPTVLINYNISKDPNHPNHIFEIFKEKNLAYILLNKIRKNTVLIIILTDDVSIIS